jgi:glycerate dehydrogenase
MIITLVKADFSANNIGLLSTFNVLTNIIGGAVLDVFEVEPISEDNPLLHINNRDRLLLTPHIAWASIESRNRLFEGVLENIEAFYNNEIKNRVEI